MLGLLIRRQFPGFSQGFGLIVYTDEVVKSFVSRWASWHGSDYHVLESSKLRHSFFAEETEVKNLASVVKFFMTNDVPMARIRSLQQRYTVGQNADGQTNEFAESDWLAFRSLLAADPDLIYDPVVTTANAFMLAETLQSDSVAEHCFQHMQHGTYFIYYELKRFPEIPHSTQGLQFIHDEQILFSEIPEWAHEKNRRWGFYGSDGHNNPGMEF